MDKYEYNLKLDEMKALAADRKYEAAAEIADTFNWNKIKNINALIKASEIYENIGRYEESEEILLMAYDRSPIGRMILYRLTMVAVRMGAYDDAKEYYHEFVEVAPHDALKYVLKYEICKGQGADKQELISILEQLKEQEYSEEWAYELAHLYHEAGMSEKCIETCDELILWFGDGPYVERALELKMIYQPLTKQQEEKYRQFRLRRNGVVEVTPEDSLESGEIVNETVQIPKVKPSAERFNTRDLQEELQRSMQQIIDATEKETVDDSMDNIKKLVEEIPYLQLPREEAVPDEVHIETDAEIDDSLKSNFQELLAEDQDGQMSMFVPEQGQSEPQVSGQMSIEDVLAEWEKTKRAAETALLEAEQRKLESAKARALQEAGDIMDRLADVIPKLDSGLTPRELLEEQYMAGEPESDDKAAQMVADMNRLLQQEIDRISDENAKMDEQIAAAGVGTIDSGSALAEAVGLDAETAAYIMSQMEDEAGAEADIPTGQNQSQEMSEIQDSDEVVETEDTSEQEDNATEDIPDMQEIFAESVAEILDESAEEAEPDVPTQNEIIDIDGTDDADALIKHDARAQIESETEASEEISEIIPEDIWQDTDDGSDKGSDVAEEQDKVFAETTASDIPNASSDYQPKQIEELNSEQKEIFSYFVPVRGMEDQICKALTGAVNNIGNAERTAGNIIIQGGSGSGKTVLATSMIKAIQQETGMITGKIGRIEAASLNQKDMKTVFEKVSGGCLIIEKAGDLADGTITRINQEFEDGRNKVLVILEDSRRAIDRLLSRDAAFASRFSEKITVPVFTSDELVEFAKSYAKELGYTIDEMGVLALYNSISTIQKLDQATTLEEVKEIVDRAAAHSEKGGLKKAFAILAARRYDAEDYVILHEKDFGF